MGWCKKLKPAGRGFPLGGKNSPAAQAKDRVGSIPHIRTNSPQATVQLRNHGPATALAEVERGLSL